MWDKALIALIGGLLLLVMGIGMLYNSIEEIEVGPARYSRSPVLAGMLLSLGNPYFLIWWATVGAVLIFFIFALVHWLCDFLWYYLLSALSFRGGQFFGKSFQRTIFAISGVFLLFFSGRFIFDAVKVLFYRFY